MRRALVASLCLAALSPRPSAAQHDMANHQHGTPAALPTSSGQSAFATIAEVVAILKADPATDWSKVNIEALRQHLIDMDDVVMHSTVAKRDVPGGMEATVTGSGRTVAAIRRMLTMHSSMLDMDTEYHAVTAQVPNGIRFTVTAKNAADSAQVARIRGLGFAGLLTEGDHHARHHLAIARGDAHPHS